MRKENMNTERDWKEVYRLIFTLMALKLKVLKTLSYEVGDMTVRRKLEKGKFSDALLDVAGFGNLTVEERVKIENDVNKEVFV